MFDAFPLLAAIASLLLETCAKALRPSRGLLPIEAVAPDQPMEMFQGSTTCQSRFFSRPLTSLVAQRD
ncbi:hypothetical protein ACCT30_11775, partial [Rhizobium ruizarguesonis]